MPKIGIILRDYLSQTGNNLYGIRTDLISYLRKYNVEVIGIPVILDSMDDDEEFRRVEEALKECRGVILPGGANLYDIDLKITKYLYEQDIPTLGICLGMQIMSVFKNGDIEYLKNKNHQSNDDYVHNIKIKENSLLAKILGEKQIKVNSRHLEHITTTDLNIVAIAEDLTIEAVEDPTKRFFVGVQWHPESLSNDIYSKKLFDYFLNQIS